MTHLNLDLLKSSASSFGEVLSVEEIPDLFGVTDGKAVGTHVENAFHEYLEERFDFNRGNAARGIDFPAQNVDLKVTSIRQPQSSSPFRNAEQKVYGLGHHLLVFIYDKRDVQSSRTAILDIRHVFFVDSTRTADYQTTRGLRDLLSRDANEDDIVGFINERNIPVDDIGATQLAQRILRQPPEQGYLTISNALQWRLQYGRLITLSEGVELHEGLEGLR